MSPDTQGTLQLAALGLIALGALVAARYAGLGGAVVVVASVALGILAAVQYHPAAALPGVPRLPPAGAAISVAAPSR